MAARFQCSERGRKRPTPYLRFDETFSVHTFAPLRGAFLERAGLLAGVLEKGSGSLKCLTVGCQFQPDRCALRIAFMPGCFGCLNAVQFLKTAGLRIWNSIAVITTPRGATLPTGLVLPFLFFKESIMQKYIVEYTIPYIHRVWVGIEANSDVDALEAAKVHFSDASIWDDTEELPLLYDEYDETDAPGVPVEFSIVDTVEDWPEADYSVKTLRSRNAAFRACETLLEAFKDGEAGNIDLESLKDALSEAHKADPLVKVLAEIPARLGSPAIALVGIEGGLVTGVTANIPLGLAVLDYDLAKDGEGHDVQAIAWPDGSHSNAVVITHTASVELGGFAESVFESCES